MSQGSRQLLSFEVAGSLQIHHTEQDTDGPVLFPLPDPRPWLSHCNGPALPSFLTRCSFYRISIQVNRHSLMAPPIGRFHHLPWFSCIAGPRVYLSTLAIPWRITGLYVRPLSLYPLYRRCSLSYRLPRPTLFAKCRISKYCLRRGKKEPSSIF